MVFVYAFYAFSVVNARKISNHLESQRRFSSIFVCHMCIDGREAPGHGFTVRNYCATSYAIDNIYAENAYLCRL